LKFHQVSYQWYKYKLRHLEDLSTLYQQTNFSVQQSTSSTADKNSVWISWEDRFLSESYWPIINTHCPIQLTLYNNKIYSKSSSMLGIVTTEGFNLLVCHAVSQQKAGIFCDVEPYPHRRPKSSVIWGCILTEGLNLLEYYAESSKRLRYSEARYESLNLAGTRSTTVNNPILALHFPAPSASLKTFS